MKRLYFDWNASAPLRECARQALSNAVGATGNPSSVHAEGRALRDMVENCRKRIASAIDARNARIVFTSGATEGNNLAILGTARNLEKRTIPRTFVTSALEHPAVKGPAAVLESGGWTVTRLRPDAAGLLSEHAIREHVSAASFASIMLASNEVGTLQNINIKDLSPRGLVHTDATQAIGKIPFSFAELGVDMATITGHKFGGPKGIGALVVRDVSLVAPLFHGGEHEFGLRPGTENVAGIAGFTAALEEAVANVQTDAAYLLMLNGLMREELGRRFPGCRVLNPVDRSLPNTLSVLIQGVEGRSLVVALDLAGVAVSVGSACASGSILPSQVLLSLGLSAEEARSTIRISMGPTHTREDVFDLLNRLERVVACQRQPLRPVANPNP